jgi:hypothetical protein
MQRSSPAVAKALRPSKPKLPHPAASAWAKNGAVPQADLRARAYKAILMSPKATLMGRVGTLETHQLTGHA